MTVREEAKWCIQQDGMLAEIRKKIRSGKATYEDTAAYSARAGKMIGALFSRRLPEIPPEEREQLCVELLHDQYIDINAAVDAAQRYLDERLGIQLAPQHAPFDSERGHQIGSSLRDLSKPVEVLQRRAKAATETTVKSMHDDRMKSEAKFRHKAGLKCTVNRVAAAKCCEWCDQVAGKYAYEDTPPDLWRRHDNCNCTIVYGTRRDRQVLRGTEKKWEIVAEGAGAPEPVRLTPEQARKLQEKHQLKRLTKDSKPAIMKNIELPPETDQIRSMSAETKQLISEAFDKVMGMYEVHLDQLITEPIYKEDGKTIANTVPFQFQPRRGQDGEIVKCLVINSMYYFKGSQDEMQQRIMRNFNNKALASNSIEGLIAHELAHIMTFQSEHTYSGLLQTNKQLTKAFEILSESCDLSEISLYAATKSDVSEVIAEAFVKVLRGEAIPEPVMPYLNEYIERWRK